MINYLLDKFTPREGTGENAKMASLTVLEEILYYLFKTPFVIWNMSNKYLKELREQKMLDITAIDSPWAYIIYLFRFVFKFLLHCLIYLSLVLLPIVAFAVGIRLSSFWMFVLAALCMYYAPLPLRLSLELFRLFYAACPYIWSAIVSLFNVVKLPFRFVKFLLTLCDYGTDKYDTRKK